MHQYVFCKNIMCMWVSCSTPSLMNSYTNSHWRPSGLNSEGALIYIIFGRRRKISALIAIISGRGRKSRGACAPLEPPRWAPLLILFPKIYRFPFFLLFAFLAMFLYTPCIVFFFPRSLKKYLCVYLH